MNSHNITSIEIVKEDHKVHSVKIVMPVWKKLGNDGITYVNMPLLGLNTYGKGDEDVDTAISETIIAFCIASEKFGLGLESELDFFGWKRTLNTPNSIIFNIESDNPFMEEVMDTGLEKAFDLDIPEVFQLECA